MEPLDLALLVPLGLIPSKQVQAMVHCDAHNPGACMLNVSPILTKYGDKNVVAEIFRILRVPQHVVAGAVHILVVSITDSSLEKPSASMDRPRINPSP